MRGSGDRWLLYLNPCRGVKSVKAVGECSVPVPGTSKCQAVAPSKARSHKYRQVAVRATSAPWQQSSPVRFQFSNNGWMDPLSRECSANATWPLEDSARVVSCP